MFLAESIFPQRYYVNTGGFSIAIPIWGQSRERAGLPGTIQVTTQKFLTDFALYDIPFTTYIHPFPFLGEVFLKCNIWLMHLRGLKSRDSCIRSHDVTSTRGLKSCGSFIRSLY